MNRKTPFFLIDRPDNAACFRSGGITLVDCRIPLYGDPMALQIGVANEPARLLDIIPLAHSISDTLSLSILNYLATKNQTVPCHQGCSACCHYLVALSLPEVFYLREDLVTLPADCRDRYLASCCRSAQRILDFDRFQKHNLDHHVEMSRLSDWYAELELPCPFLMNGSCLIYEKRPLACREYMVTTSPSRCQTDGSADPAVVPLPVSILEALGQLSADLEQTPVEAVMLPLALACGDDRDAERSQRTWPAIEMAERFVQILDMMAQKNVPEFEAVGY